MTDAKESGLGKRADILVLLPVLDEEQTIEQVIRQTFATDAVDHILVIDDGSTDATHEKLQTLSQEFPELDVVVRSERGFGTALHTGFRLALERYDFDRLVTLDADLSHDPALIPDLLSTNADLVLGSRYSDGGTIQDWPFARRAISYAANSVSRHLLGLPARDITTGYRVYSRSLVDRIVRDAACGGYEFQVEAIWLAQNHDFHVAEVPICFVERRAGRSKLATTEESLRFSRFVLDKSVRRLWQRVTMSATRGE